MNLPGHAKIFICLSISTFLWGCGRIPDMMPKCEETFDFGPFTLSDSIDALFPYADTIERLVFIDEAETEHHFNLDVLNNSFIKLFYTHACPYDTSQDVTYVQFQEVKNVVFINDVLNISLHLHFQAVSYLDDTTLIGESDVLYLDVRDRDLNPSPVLRFQLRHKYGVDFWGPIEVKDSILINGNRYVNVYSQTLGELPKQEWIGYFNFEKGIVGLEHASGSPLLSLVRIE